MKIVLAPDSFKESMTAKEVCAAMTEGIRKVFKDADIVSVPMADGGEGTMQSLVDATNGNICFLDVTGPLGNKVKAKYGILGDGNTAVIEIAEACGIHLVNKKDRNPLITTTYGVGEILKEVLNKNISNIIVALGGSATNDGGTGMLKALGMRFLDEKDKDIDLGGGALSDLKKIDISGLDKRIFNVNIIAACDVKNYLTGDNGASFVFGRQKGASTEDIRVLDENLKRYSEIVQKQFGKDIDKIEGAGAAGGLGSAFIGFLNAKMENGLKVVAKYCRLEEKLLDADFVFTGEGSIDRQTKEGKTPYGVAKIAKNYNIPVICLCGRIGRGIEELYDGAIDSVICILGGCTDINTALKEGKENVVRTTENVCRLLNANN